MLDQRTIFRNFRNFNEYKLGFNFKEYCLKTIVNYINYNCNLLLIENRK